MRTEREIRERIKEMQKIIDRLGSEYPTNWDIDYSEHSKQIQALEWVLK